jgi:hypothetical protein
MPNQIDQARFQFLVEKGLTKAFEEQIQFLSQTQPIRARLFADMESDGAYSDFNSVGSLPDMPRFSGALFYADVPPGWAVRIEPAEFAMGVEIEKKFWLNNLYNVLKDWPKKLAIASDRTKEKAAVSAYANISAAGFDFMQSEEGVAIASSGHLTKQTDVNTTVLGGFSNLGSSTFLPTTVEATRILMRGFRDTNGEILSINPNGFVGATTLDQKFKELNATPHGLYSAEGTINVQKDQWSYETHQYFNDYSTKNWMMVDWQLLAEYAKWVTRVEDELTNKVDFETKKIKHSAYNYWGYGFLNWPFIYFQQVG